MKVAGIITEYNPFHNGHKIHLENTKKITGADFVIAVMSGNFVQRGEPAVMNKYLRTKTALMAGADLVIELPAIYSCASAEFFAGASIALLDKLGVVTRLVFGSECGDADALTDTAKLLSEESEEFKILLNEFLRQGNSYPLAVSKAYSSFSGGHDYLATPNNMLGIEYIKALLKRHSAIVPMTYKREGSYNDRQINISSPSAAAIREELFSIASDSELTYSINAAVPDFAYDIMSGYYKQRFPVNIDMLSMQLAYKILSEKDSLTKYADVSPAIENRIKSALSVRTRCSDILKMSETKAYTHARLSRCLMHILLDIKASDMETCRNNDYIGYARVLGFRKAASPLLSEIKKNSSIPLITKLAGFEKQVDEFNASILKKEIFASNLYEAAVSNIYKTAPINEFTKGIIII